MRTSVHPFLLFSILLTISFFPSLSFSLGSGYRVVSVSKHDYGGGFVVLLELNKGTTIFGPDIQRLQLYVKHETESCLRVHITDAEKPRWEVPYNLLPRSAPPPQLTALNFTRIIETDYFSNYDPTSTGSESDLTFGFNPNPFGFWVTRKSDGVTLFNSTAEVNGPFGPMVYKDQYLEISTSLPETGSNLYGLGENTQPGGIRLKPYDPYTLYTTDISANNLNTDLYGSHPYYMELRNNINGDDEVGFHGVLLLNSNAMDVVYRGNSLTYKVIGGLLDFYFFAGPSAMEVMDQYTSFVGRPAPMPYWAFGFHQCRWGYRNITQVAGVVEGYQNAAIPLDVMWTDDDHMDLAKDFTLDPIHFPVQKMQTFLATLRSRGMKYIVLIDPGINVNQTYGTYTRGMSNDVYIKLEGEPYLAQVWPGAVYFPDFLNPQTVSWWVDEIKRFRQMLPVDGLWVDMNEPSNFCTGKCVIPKDYPCPTTKGNASDCCLDCTNLNTTKWDNPPYIAASATHYNGVLEYNAHSLYGFSQTIATHKGLLASTNGKRPFILTRSTFVGSGQYAAHWTGDNKGDWDNLRYSISTILNFGIFGMPMVGSDICGFYPSPTEELCNRWIELGAFYPFSRDHASNSSAPQELYVWKSVAQSARNALGLRYRLLPYFYTLNYHAHTTGAPMARPIFFTFPTFAESYNLSTQFLLGDNVLVSPVLQPNTTIVKALFPPGTWYNLFDHSKAIVSKGEYAVLNAPLHVINVHLYQNTILPMQRGGLVSSDARKTPFTLVVTFPFGAVDDQARGSVFVDVDEDPVMALRAGNSTYVDLFASIRGGEVKVWSKVSEGEYARRLGLMAERVVILGMDGNNGVMSVDGLKIEVEGKTVSAPKTEDVTLSKSEVLDAGMMQGKGEVAGKNGAMVQIGGLNLPLGNEFSLTWKR